VLYIFSTSFFTSHRKNPPKEQNKIKLGYICAQCRNLNKDTRDWNISKGLTIEEDSFRHFLYFGFGCNKNGNDKKKHINYTTN
jgi:hypothetical protein